MRQSASERRTIFLLGALLIFGPALAALSGVRGSAMENRPLAKGPSLSKGWDAADEVSAWANDHLPLRNRAVNLDSWVDEHVFADNPTAGQSRTPKVVIGKNGWLFLGEDLTKACEPLGNLTNVFSNLTKIHDALDRLGKRFLVVVAPDKTTFMDNQLRSSANVKCARAFKEQLWNQLETTPPPGYVDVRTPLEQERTRNPRDLYHHTDTHWNDYAASVATKAVIDNIDPQLWNTGNIVRLADQHKAADLTRLLGRSTTERAPTLELRRQVVRSATETNDPRIPQSLHVSNTAIGSTPLVPGSALFLHDSFGELIDPMLSTFFADFVSMAHIQMSPEIKAQRFLEADTVIYEVVERHLVEQFNDSNYWAGIIAQLDSSTQRR